MLHRFLVVILILTCGKNFCQDAYFTNTNQSLIYLNPAYAGNNGFFRIQSIAKVQDYNSRRSFVTSYTSLDAYLKKTGSGLAFSYLYDDYSKGQVRSWAYSLTFAQHFFLKDKTWRVSPSIQASMQSRQLNVNNIRYGDTINRRSHTIFNIGNGMPAADRSFFDFSSGVIIQNRESSFGVAVFHINQPDEGLLGSEALPFRINVHGAYIFRLKEDVNLSVSGYYINQDAFWDTHLNVNLLWNNELFFGAGVWRSKCVTANVGFQANVFRLGVGYNYSWAPAPDPWIHGKSSLELMLSFNFSSKNSENSSTADWRTW